MLLSREETKRIVGQFSPEFWERMKNRFWIEQIEAAIADGKMPKSALIRYCLEHGIPMVGGSAVGFYITNAEAISMLTDHGVGIDAGTAAVINIYDSTVPTDADTALGAQVLLAQLTCSATAFTSVADDTPGAIATFASITADASANASGTATFFRILTQNAGTVTDQGTVGTSSADLIMNTVAFTAGSNVAISAATILLPEGP